MRPISRAAASIEVIDDYLSGKPIEVALKKWFRDNRFAGSNDRYAIRNIIFDVLRKRRSLIFPFQIAGREENGRLLILSYLADHYEQTELIKGINQNKYFEEPPSSNELTILEQKNKILSEAPNSVVLDYPSFLTEGLAQFLGKNFEIVMGKMRERAPLYLRLNRLKGRMNEIEDLMAAEGIVCSRLSGYSDALQVDDGRRLVKSSKCYTSGMVEIQDLSSQVMSDLPEIIEGTRILDYCAGGGGKTLAMASKINNKGDLLAFDINQKRLVDLRRRVIRAGARVRLLQLSDLKDYISSCDVVFVDAPCSGSGIWRRDPEAKWNLTKNRLEELIVTQLEILEDACKYVKVGGVIIYVVCSMLPEEGDIQVDKFLSKKSNFKNLNRSLLHPLVAGDGFFRAVLKRLK